MTPTPLRKTRAALAFVLFALLACVPAPAQSPPAVGQTISVESAALPGAPGDDSERRAIRRNKPAGDQAATRPTTQRTTAAGAARPPAGSTGLDVRRLVTALGVVLVLILLARWFARRYFGVAGAARSTRAVQVLSRSTLSPKQQLMLVRVGRRLLVVGDGGGQLNTLSEITDPDEVAALVGQVQGDHAARATKSFGSLFGRMQGKFGDEADEQPHAEPEPAHRHGLDAAGPRAVDGGDHDGQEDPAVESARQELGGLMDRVRMLSRQFKNP